MDSAGLPTRCGVAFDEGCESGGGEVSEREIVRSQYTGPTQKWTVKCLKCGQNEEHSTNDWYTKIVECPHCGSSEEIRESDAILGDRLPTTVPMCRPCSFKAERVAQAKMLTTLKRENREIAAAAFNRGKADTERRLIRSEAKQVRVFTEEQEKRGMSASEFESYLRRALVHFETRPCDRKRMGW